MMITEQLKHFRFTNSEEVYQKPLIKSVRWGQDREFHFKDVKLKEDQKLLFRRLHYRFYKNAMR